MATRVSPRWERSGCVDLEGQIAFLDTQESKQTLTKSFRNTLAYTADFESLNDLVKFLDNSEGWIILWRSLGRGLCSGGWILWIR